MPVVLTVLSGPLANRTFEFDESKTRRVRIGRALDAEVSWPEEEPIVGREHFELQFESGTWKFALNPEHRVFAGAIEAYDRMPVGDEATIHLGRRDGPSLLLKQTRKTDTNQALTLEQGTAIDDRGLIEMLRKNMGRVAAALAVVAAISAYGYMSLRGDVTVARDGIEQLAAEQSKIEQSIASLVSGTDFSDTYEKLRPSIFYIDIVAPGNVTRGGATAWVVQLKDGRKAFATNAHVAAEYERQVNGNTGGLRMVARSTVAPFSEHEIVGQISHPAYAEFNQKLVHLEEQIRLGKTRDVGLTLGYDVAVLVPASQDGLPGALPLADQAEIAALRTGHVVATAGFPTEGVTTTDRMQPTPRLQPGYVISMTSFFLMPAGADSQLVLHNLPATGGASGSPIFNAAGKVVAVLNGGNVTTSGDGNRTPSAVQVNFAQRVDLLRELINEEAASRMETYRRLWDKIEASVGRSAREYVDAAVAAFQEANVGEALAGNTSGRIDTPNPAHEGRLTATVDLPIEAGYRYLVLAMSEDKRAKLSALLHERSAASYLDAIASGAPVAELEFNAIKSQPTRLVLVQVAEDANGQPDLTPIDFSVVVWKVKT